MTFFIPIKDLWTRVRDFTSVAVHLIGRRQQDRVDEVEREQTRFTWTWREGVLVHSFTGTPAEYRWFLERDKTV